LNGIQEVTGSIPVSSTNVRMREGAQAAPFAFVAASEPLGP
jgi:hypothetical protein